MNPEWLVVTALGAAILAGSVVGALGSTIPPAEVRVFHALNGLPGWLYNVLWLPMQLGNLVVGMLTGLAVAFAHRDLAVVIGVVLATALKLVTERLIRREMAGHLAVRQRPGTSQVGATLRGDVPSSGPSFPSGHVILVAAIGTVVAPNLAAVWWWLPLLLMLLVAVGRVYVGAHNPLDVTAGLGAGLLLGGILAMFVN